MLFFEEGILCQWSNGQCIDFGLMSSGNQQSFCSEFSDYPCATCLGNAYNCRYCDSSCGDASAVNCNDKCPLEYDAAYCESLQNCQLCETVSGCGWETNRCVQVSSPQNSSKCHVNATCDAVSSCGDCSSRRNCMWCQNLDKCIATNSYVLQFPYGQCIEWVRSRSCPAYHCSAHQTCIACQNHTQCGWCDDGSMTGKGKCVEGGGSSPLNTSSGNEFCSAESWYFVDCPSCQCNGHSTCNGSFHCINCKDNTAGEQCEKCADGFFGNSLNGGNCSKCECGKKALNCNPSTGFCFCSTKGEIGMTCEKCDIQNGYFGNASANGTCFYNVQENYIFTFTLTPPGDEYVTAINFQNRPGTNDDVDVSVKCDQACDVRLAVLLNITGAEVVAFFASNVTSLDHTLQTNIYKFQELNAVIRIYVSNFTVPFEVKVSVTLVQINYLL